MPPESCSVVAPDSSSIRGGFTDLPSDLVIPYPQVPQEPQAGTGPFSRPAVSLGLVHPCAAASPELLICASHRFRLGSAVSGPSRPAPRVKRG